MDDLGTTYDGPRPARRVVSLVPSLTEALVSVDRAGVVGATEWCIRPADLDTTRVRGTKNPDLAAVRALEPDVVVANKEENRELDVRRLRDSGVRVWVTDIETVPGAVASMERLLDGIGWERPDWLARARDLWCGPLPEVTRRVVVPIWRDPWMVVGPATFTSDLCRRLGWQTLPGPDHGTGDAAASRYPTMSVEEIDGLGADAVLLPDEPYEFTATDGPEALVSPCELVDGRLLTWYGPSLLDARTSVERRGA